MNDAKANRKMKPHADILYSPGSGDFINILENQIKSAMFSLQAWHQTSNMTAKIIASQTLDAH